MDGIKNLLTFLDSNWTTILVCLGIIVGLVQKTITYFSKTDEERAEIAKEHIKEEMLKRISDAEQDYTEWNKAGEIKRSQVIKQIYSEYPILNKVKNQEELTKWIDEQINDSLKTLRKIIEEQ